MRQHLEKEKQEERPTSQDGLGKMELEEGKINNRRPLYNGKHQHRGINTMDLLKQLKAAFTGKMGELSVSFAQWLFLKPNIYKPINNIIIPTPDGTTQIDHIIISIYGIFVIETKTMEGWIFGNEKDPYWTQSIYGHKYKFQNPLRQNYKHTKALAEFLAIPHEKFHSIIMFIGNSAFKTPMPANVLDKGLITYIKSKKDILLREKDLRNIIFNIERGKVPNTWANRKSHVNALNQRYQDNKNCPKCGGTLILRMATSGKHTGKEFYGCNNFPKCRYIQNRDKTNP